MNCAHGTDEQLQLQAVCFLHEQSCTITATSKRGWHEAWVAFWLKKTAKRGRRTAWNFLIDEEFFFLLNRWSLHAKHGRIPQTWGRRVHQWPQQRLPLLVAAAAAAATLGQALALTALSQVHQCLRFLWPQSPPQRPSQVPRVKAVVSCCVVPCWFLEELDSLWNCLMEC